MLHESAVNVYCSFMIIELIFGFAKVIWGPYDPKLTCPTQKTYPLPPFPIIVCLFIVLKGHSFKNLFNHSTAGVSPVWRLQSVYSYLTEIFWSFVIIEPTSGYVKILRSLISLYLVVCHRKHEHFHHFVSNSFVCVCFLLSRVIPFRTY